MTPDTIRELLGWWSLINVTLFTLSSFALMCWRKKIGKLHMKIFGLNEHAVYQSYFCYLAGFKLLIIVFNLAPLLALWMMKWLS